ncbi:short transient receptor potential channel 4-like isoform X1 [Stegodyphus dumicola]|uniref:short transient receptor potential channel 4-like isoform X1 n=1 Tax=Stegodyphus dumicola TaxID=202533 RepID=UPI0015AA5C7F|nr:short transient receptor potential channel 4-like isoform X1 [Stegodyphus dumicola]
MDDACETIFLRKRVCDKVDSQNCDCPVGLVKQRASHVEDYMSDEEREFLWLVQIGDLEGIKSFLESHTINTDCCDYRGQRALDIAVSNRDVELVIFLLDNLAVTTIHYYCAILRAVFENDAIILEMLLDRAEEDNRLHSHLKELITGGSECTKCLPEVVATNMTPTMAASIKGNVETTRILLEKGYCIQKPHSPKCQCREYCSKRCHDGETLTESISRMNAYRALASPTYLILTSEDPILAAFELSQELIKLSKELPENQKEYQELSSQCSKFAADILNECRNTKEVQTVLVQKRGLKDPRPHRFSRLHLAVQWEQKEFVTHPSCQQVLRSLWVETVGSWYSWPFRWRAFYVMKHAVLTPVVSIAFIFIPRAEIIGPLRVPLNRFIYFATSYIFFLSLLMVTLLNDRRYDVHSPATWTEMAVGCFVLGHSWDILTNLISVGFSNYFRSYWAVFDLVMFSMFLVTEILWFSVFIYNLFSDNDTHNSNRMCWDWYHPILLGEGIYAAASVMAFSRLLLWFHINSRLGPLGTSIKYMLTDVARFFMLFFIIMLAFATGINSLYKNYKDSEQYDDTDIIRQPDAFIT